MSGSRNETYRELPGETPSFKDVCPCGSDNVDVIDPVVQRAAATNHRFDMRVES